MDLSKRHEYCFLFVLYLCDFERASCLKSTHACLIKLDNRLLLLLHCTPLAFHAYIS